MGMQSAATRIREQRHFANDQVFFWDLPDRFETQGNPVGGIPDAIVADMRIAGPAALRASWETLLRRARFIAQGRADADDLLAAAVAATWEKWVAGTGPTTNIVAYVAQSMRNRLADDLKAARAGELPLEALPAHPTHCDDRSRIERHQENADVRAALGRLPIEQRRVLIDTVVNGRKPRDLEGEYAQTAPAISTAAYRAKKGLRSELFLHLVRESCAQEECALAQARVARDLWRTGVLSDSSARVFQLWHCAGCAEGIRRYIDMTGMVAA